MFWMSKRKQRDLDRERNSERNRAYIEGYSAGYKNGKSDGLTMRITPNQIRFAFGLPEIEAAEREEKQMKVIIRHYADHWQIIKDNALFTIHKFGGGQYPTTDWKKKILIAEHSPIRSGRLIVEVHDVPSFVIGHFVRHNQGFVPFVSSLRYDRTEYENGKVPDRNTPNGLRFDGNFQSFINISRKRYCGQASKETRDVWNAIMSAVAEYEPELYFVCVPECVYRGGCSEFAMCGGQVWRKFFDNLNTKGLIETAFVSIPKRYEEWHRFKNKNFDEAK